MRPVNSQRGNAAVFNRIGFERGVSKLVDDRATLHQKITEIKRCLHQSSTALASKSRCNVLLLKKIMMPAQLLVQSFVAFAGGLAGGGLLAFTTIVAGDTLLLSTPSAGEGCRVITV